MSKTLEHLSIEEKQDILFELERQFERKRVYKTVALFFAISGGVYAALSAFPYVWLLITNCC